MSDKSDSSDEVMFNSDGSEDYDESLETDSMEDEEVETDEDDSDYDSEEDTEALKAEIEKLKRERAYLVKSLREATSKSQNRK